MKIDRQRQINKLMGRLESVRTSDAEIRDFEKNQAEELKFVRKDRKQD